ncbi:hypothetical protein JCM8097_002302 [Rhodosporidiobolus ruineniae]
MQVDRASPSGSAPSPITGSASPFVHPPGVASPAVPMLHGVPTEEPHQPTPPAQARHLAQQQVEEQAPLVDIVHFLTLPAVHRLAVPPSASGNAGDFTFEQQVGRFGPAGMQIHGHEYTFAVKFRGPVCRRTGQIMGSELLEDIVEMAIGDVLTRKNLDTDISFFASRPSTLENLCLFAWRNVSVIIAPHPFDVCEVSVECEACPKEPGRHADGQRGRRTRVSFAGALPSFRVCFRRAVSAEPPD